MLLAKFSGYWHRIGRDAPRNEPTFDEVNQQIVQSEGRLMARIEYNNRLVHARALDSSAVISDARIHPLPLPNGDNPPPGALPAAIDALRRLEGPALADLLELYGLPPQAQVAQRGRVLAGYFGVQW
ncbi:hypothetical protein FRC08_012237 [Ceratobasidium sp. 394]|nr:hypothetical protein FRC08_012237 [Ceratobasidium sp. 394]